MFWEVFWNEHIRVKVGAGWRDPPFIFSDCCLHELLPSMDMNMKRSRREVWSKGGQVRRKLSVTFYELEKLKGKKVIFNMEEESICLYCL
jgi:hypothetical protein